MDARALANSLLQDFAALVREGAGHSLRDVSAGEMGVLGYIHYTGGGVTPTDISRQFRISTARVANVLKALERKRYIERRNDPADRRKSRVFVTAEGRAITEKCIDDAVSHTQTVLELLGEKDAEETVRLLRRIRTVHDEQWGKAPEDKEVHT